MGSSALGAEAVEHRDAERADEVALRSPARGLLLEVEAERAAMLAGLPEEPGRAGRPLERWDRARLTSRSMCSETGRALGYSGPDPP
jgi:hypothetical protein